jgi:hypothetical protein
MGLTTRSSTGGACAEADEKADGGLDVEAVDWRRAHAEEADRRCADVEEGDRRRAHAEEADRRRALRLMRRRSARA